MIMDRFFFTVYFNKMGSILTQNSSKIDVMRTICINFATPKQIYKEKGYGTEQ